MDQRSALLAIATSQPRTQIMHVVHFAVLLDQVRRGEDSPVLTVAADNDEHYTVFCHGF
jgi:hypothetical protein